MAARHPVVTRLPLLVATAQSVRWWGFGLTYEMSMVSPHSPQHSRCNMHRRRLLST